MGCSTCRDAGLGPSVYSVRGRGWRCKCCGWTLIAPETWNRHERSDAHRQAELTLERRTSLQTELASLMRQVQDTDLERRQIRALTEEELGRREAEARAEIGSRLRERQTELSEVETELGRRRDQLAALEARAKVLRPDESRESILEAARAEARAIREQAEKNAEELQRRAEGHQLSEYDTRLRDRKAELEKLEERMANAQDDFEKELRRQAVARTDQALWELAPAEVKEWFSYERDPEMRTNLAIAVLINRRETDRRIAELMAVPPSRVRDARSGDGDKDSLLELVREWMGPPPEGWRPLGEAPPAPNARGDAPEGSRTEAPGKPRDEDALLRAAAFRLYDERKSVRDVSRETGRSVGWAGKLRKEWEAHRSDAPT